MPKFKVEISDGVDASISKKLSDIASEASKASINAADLAGELRALGASKSAIRAQQNLSKSLSRQSETANRAIAAQARLRSAQLKTARGARNAAREHTKASRSIVASGARVISIATRYAGLLGITFSLGSFAKVADGYTLIGNKLQNVTTSTANFARVQNEVFAAADRSLVPVGEMAQTFQRLDLALKNTGLSQKEVLGITETASKSLIIGGANAQETAAAMLQLSQAFNKGKLDGDEFRTVMELMPDAADAISKELGVTRGALLELAPQGKITAEVMARAFSKASDEIQSKFSKMTPTISQSMVVLQNRSKKFFGELHKGLGVTESISKAILAFSDNLDKIVPVIGIAGGTLLAFFGARAVQDIGLSTKALKAFNFLLATNPYVLATTALAALTLGMVAYSDQIAISEDGFVKLNHVGKAMFEFLGQAVRNAKQDWKQAWSSMKKFMVQTWNDLKITAGPILTWLSKELKTLFNWLSSTANKALTLTTSVFSNLKLVAAVTFQTILQKGADMVNSMVNFFIGGINKMLSALNSIPGASKITGGLIQLDPITLQAPDSLFGIDNLSFQGNEFLTKLLRDFKFFDNFDTAGQIMKNLSVSASIFKGELELGTDALMKRAREIAAADAQKRKDDEAFDAARKRRLDAEKQATEAAKKAAQAMKKHLPGEAIGIRPQAQSNSISCGQTSCAVAANSLTGKSINDNVFNSRHGLYLLTGLNKEIRETGIRYEDYGNISRNTLKWIKKATDKGFPVVFAGNGPDFSPTGRGHVMLMKKVTDEIVTFMDPAKGIMRNMLTSKFLENSRNFSHPNGNFVFGPANLDSLAPRNQEGVKQAFDNENKALKIAEDAAKQAKKRADSIEKAKNSLTAKIPIMEELTIDQEVTLELASQINNFKQQDIVLNDTELRDFEKIIRLGVTRVRQLEIEKKLKSDINSIISELGIKTNNPLAKYSSEIQKLKEGLDSGIISQSEFEQASKILSENLNKTLNPMKEINQNLDKERELLRLSSEELTVYNELQKIQLNTKQQLSETEKARLETKIRDRIEDEKRKASAEKVRSGDLTDVSKSQILDLEQTGFITPEQSKDSTKEREKLDFLERLDNARDFFSQMEGLSRTGNKKLIAIGKAAAMARAAIDTYSAVHAAWTWAIKDAKLGPFAAGALAAATLAQGLARMSQIASQGEGFKQGGFTGNMPTNKIAGVVHGQEFVMNAQATKRIGVDNLQRLQNGGSVQGLPVGNMQAQKMPAPVVNSPTNVTIVPSREAALSALRGREGETLILETIENNGNTIARILQQK